MTQIHIRLPGLGAMALTVALAFAASIPAAALAQDEAAPDAETAEAVEPTPEPTPFPEFDPDSVTLRLDLFADGFDAPVYIADDGIGKQQCRYVVERGGRIKVGRP